MESALNKFLFYFIFLNKIGTIIACDIAIRSLELPTRSVDIPQIVYFVRRGRASAVQTREQYEFVYKVSFDHFFIQNEKFSKFGNLLS